MEEKGRKKKPHKKYSSLNSLFSGGNKQNKKKAKAKDKVAAIKNKPTGLANKAVNIFKQANKIGAPVESLVVS